MPAGRLRRALSGAAAVSAIALLPAAARADVVTPKVVTPQVVAPTVVSPTVSPPQVSAPSTPSPAPAPAPATAPSQVQFEPSPVDTPPRPGWEGVRDRHERLQSDIEVHWDRDMESALRGEQTLSATDARNTAFVDDVLDSMGWLPSPEVKSGEVFANLLSVSDQDPGGILDIVDSTFGTSMGPIQQTIDAANQQAAAHGEPLPYPPESPNVVADLSGGGQTPQSAKDEFDSSKEQ